MMHEYIHRKENRAYRNRAKFIQNLEQYRRKGAISNHCDSNHRFQIIYLVIK